MDGVKSFVLIPDQNGHGRKTINALVKSAIHPKKIKIKTLNQSIHLTPHPPPFRVILRRKGVWCK
jgi:hypothetical protein